MHTGASGQWPPSPELHANDAPLLVCAGTGEAKQLSLTSQLKRAKLGVRMRPQAVNKVEDSAPLQFRLTSELSRAQADSTGKPAAGSGQAVSAQATEQAGVWTGGAWLTFSKVQCDRSRCHMSPQHLLAGGCSKGRSGSQRLQRLRCHV